MIDYYAWLQVPIEDQKVESMQIKTHGDWLCCSNTPQHLHRIQAFQLCSVLGKKKKKRERALQGDLGSERNSWKDCFTNIRNSAEQKIPEETWKRLSKGQRAALKELLNISIWMCTFLKLWNNCLREAVGTLPVWGYFKNSSGHNPRKNISTGFFFQ